MNVSLTLLCLLASSLLASQVPRIGVIDFYGLRRVSEERVRKTLGFKEGDALPPSKADVEERLEKISGVVRARLEAVCCTNGKAILYVGIEEKGARHFGFRFPPGSSVSLDQDIVDVYRRFLEEFEGAARKGDVPEDLTRGHPLAANPSLRAFQERFAAYAESHLKTLRDVLRNAADEEQRAMAAYVIGYAPRKGDVVNDLQYALQDPNDSVRHNAIRALSAISVLAKREPERRICVSPTWFIEMLNSMLWADRTRAAQILVNLSDSRDPDTLDQLRERALPSLCEMARWKTLGHALPAFILVGRIAGLPEEEIHEAWSKGQREKVIDQALGRSRDKQ